MFIIYSLSQSLLLRNDVVDKKPNDGDDDDDESASPSPTHFYESHYNTSSIIFH